jgi:hypothetical protein
VAPESGSAFQMKKFSEKIFAKPANFSKNENFHENFRENENFGEKFFFRESHN